MQRSNIKTKMQKLVVIAISGLNLVGLVEGRLGAAGELEFTSIEDKYK